MLAYDLIDNHSATKLNFWLFLKWQRLMVPLSIKAVYKCWINIKIISPFVVVVVFFFFSFFFLGGGGFFVVVVVVVFLFFFVLFFCFVIFFLLLEKHFRYERHWTNLKWCCPLQCLIWEKTSINRSEK